VRSLLPALENCPDAQLNDIYLPDRGDLAKYTRLTNGPTPRRYRRFLPAFVSRALECTLLAHQFDGDAAILVLGDVPLACNARQIVFVQTVHLAGRVRSPDWGTAIKNGVARRLIRLNSARVSAFIVQTEVMKALLEETYPHARGRVVVIPQPPPSWLLDSGLRRTGRSTPGDDHLELFYPAANHAHKNHRLLARIHPAEAAGWPVKRFTLTIPPASHPSRNVGWIECVGFLSSAEMLKIYGSADAIVFLSKAESYGLPLVEAMHIGIPIVAPDLPYARTLCGDEAIYFDPDSSESLLDATLELRDRLGRHWWPDWSDRLRSIPDSWTNVAQQFIQTVAKGAPEQ
jgi:Glycosyl transferases group 1